MWLEKGGGASQPVIEGTKAAQALVEMVRSDMGKDRIPEREALGWQSAGAEAGWRHDTVHCPHASGTASNRCSSSTAPVQTDRIHNVCSQPFLDALPRHKTAKGGTLCIAHRDSSPPTWMLRPEKAASAKGTSHIREKKNSSPPT